MRINDIVGTNVYVKCSTEEEYISFLKAAENAGMKWVSGARPTQHFEYWEDRPIYIVCYGAKTRVGGLITRGGCTDDDIIVKFSDLDLSDYNNEKYQLEIKQKNRSVIATLYDGKGAFVKYAKAVCSPEDKFDFETGKKIALQRLFENEPEKEGDTCHKMELRASITCYGIVGEPTEVEAFGHIKLHIGDVVEIFDYEGKSLGLECICKNATNPTGFVMGVSGTKFVNGRGGGEYFNYLIIKRKSYTEMNPGDTVGVVEYRLI